MKFVWNEDKNSANFAKHRIWFEEAQTVFADKNALEIYDEGHSDDEDRFIVLGFSTALRLLTVVYCERNKEEIRIISARKATKKETRDYEKRI